MARKGARSSQTDCQGLQRAPKSDLLTVYLDTQDFSRFADAAAGRPREPGDVETLAALERQISAGCVRFVYSAMHLSELLQYDGGGRELTLRKAAMIERLCGSNALLHPGRLLALQAVEVAQAKDAKVPGKGPPLSINEEDDWHPSVAATLGDLRAQLDQAIHRRITSLGGNRRDRMAARARVRRLGASLISAVELERISSSYPFSPDVMRKGVIAALAGRRPSPEDERDFAREFAQPTRFVALYFEREEGGKTLQRWMRDFGEQLRDAVAKLRDDLVPYLDQPGLLALMRSRLEGSRLVLPRKLLSDFSDEAAALGLSDSDFEKVLNDDELLLSLPFCNLLARIMPIYIEECSGIHAASRAARPSDGGDLIHAIALTYCDLIRTDAYFGNLLGRVVPNEAGKVVPRLQELPGRIAELLARKSASGFQA